jgi:NodT family efflux transporter outer membrane factor (OMF) lipoprotein
VSAGNLIERRQPLRWCAPNHLLALAVLPLAIAGCVLKKPPDTATIQQESMPSVAVPAQWAALRGTPGLRSANWVETFQDDALVAAVKEALAQNVDLKAGAARVEQAHAYAKLAGAKLYPSVDLLARGGGKMSGDQSGLQGGVLSATWEVDLWGRVRYGRAAAAADALSAQADYEYARESIAAQVVKTWFLVIEAEQQAALARSTIHDNEEMVRLTSARLRIGAGNDEDVYVARATLGTYVDALRQIELARDDSRRALELLLGRYPAAAIEVGRQLPSLPDAVPTGLPSELLERRPDVIAAERRVAAAFNRVQEAKAARLPAIKLTTGVSSVSSDLFVLKDRDNPVWNLGANLLAPIFTGGALKRQVEIRTAEQKASLAAYAAVGLRAFNEVEAALSAEFAARDRERILVETLSHSQRALGVVRAQYKVGTTDLRFVTQRQLSVTSAQSALLRVQAEQRVQRVNLHLAVGGSFQQPAPTVITTDKPTR